MNLDQDLHTLTAQAKPEDKPLFLEEEMEEMEEMEDIRQVGEGNYNLKILLIKRISDNKMCSILLIK